MNTTKANIFITFEEIFQLFFLQFYKALLFLYTRFYVTQIYLSKIGECSYAKHLIGPL